MDPDIRIPADSSQFAAEVGIYVSRASATAIASRGKFVVALSGGSLPQLLGAALASVASSHPIEFDKWIVIYADERIVPFDHPDSNHRACLAALASTPLKATQFIPINADLASSECARDYEAKLRAELHCPEAHLTPELDLVLLGMGPDGHTASLFPGLVQRCMGVASRTPSTQITLAPTAIS